MQRDRLKQEAVEALKSGDNKKVSVLRYLVSLIDKRELQLPPEGLTEAEEINVLRKELKNKEEARAMFSKASREDLVKEEDYEIEIVKKYLPQELEEKAVREMVVKAIEEKGKNFGIVMGKVMKEVAGRAPGEVVSRVVNEELKK